MDAIKQALCLCDRKEQGKSQAEQFFHFGQCIYNFDYLFYPQMSLLLSGSNDDLLDRVIHYPNAVMFTGYHVFFIEIEVDM